MAAIDTPKKAFSYKVKSSAPQIPEDNDLTAKMKLMQEYLNEQIKQNTIVLKDAMNRNLIFVDKTRSGKSTVLEVLKNPFTFVKPASIFSETVDASINHFTVEVEGEESSANFNISIIDTPGLFEVADQSNSRDNDALEEIVLKCMNAEITKINSIFFVFSYTGAINPQDIEALERFIKLFDGAQKHVHILITRCETFSRTEKERIREELLKYPKMSELLKVISHDIFFMGAVEQRTFSQGLVESFRLTLANVVNMREELFAEIFQMEDPFNLNSLKIVDKVRANADKLYVQLQQKFKNLDQIKDWEEIKRECKKLGSWLPLLDVDKYNPANQLLIDFEKAIKGQTHTK